MKIVGNEEKLQNSVRVCFRYITITLCHDNCAAFVRNRPLLLCFVIFLRFHLIQK